MEEISLVSFEDYVSWFINYRSENQINRPAINRGVLNFWYMNSKQTSVKAL